jgi:hypothetical protein
VTRRAIESILCRNLHVSRDNFVALWRLTEHLGRLAPLIGMSLVWRRPVGGWLLLPHVHTGRAEHLTTEATSIKAYLAAGGGHVAYIAGTPSQLPAVLIGSAGSGDERPASELQSPLLTGAVPPLERHWLPSDPRLPVPIWLHLPSVPPDSPPPLLVRAPPGPTSQTRPRLDPDVQFLHLPRILRRRRRLPRQHWLWPGLPTSPEPPLAITATRLLVPEKPDIVRLDEVARRHGKPSVGPPLTL